MADYGLTDSGFNRKPLATILREIEDLNITEFGPTVIQTAQSPLGQLNGISAELASDIWAIAEGQYQQLDVEQATTDALRFWASIRQWDVGSISDDDLRDVMVPNGDQGDELKPLVAALRAIDGVTWLNITINDSSYNNLANIAPATVSIAIEGGEDADIAAAIRANIYGGVSTYGNTSYSFMEDGFERRVSWVRPVEIKTTMEVTARTIYGASWPEDTVIKSTIVNAWAEDRENGKEPDWVFVRRAVEAAFPGVEVTGVSLSYALPTTDDAFSHFHIASFDANNITLTHEN